MRIHLWIDCDCGGCIIRDKTHDNGSTLNHYYNRNYCDISDGSRRQSYIRRFLTIISISITNSIIMYYSGRTWWRITLSVSLHLQGSVSEWLHHRGWPWQQVKYFFLSNKIFFPVWQNIFFLANKICIFALVDKIFFFLAIKKYFLTYIFCWSDCGAAQEWMRMVSTLSMVSTGLIVQTRVQCLILRSPQWAPHSLS